MILSSELWNTIELTYEKLFSNGAPRLSDKEKSDVMTLAQWYYIKWLYQKNNNGKDGFEVTESIGQILSQLINDTKINTTLINEFNQNIAFGYAYAKSIFVPLPNNFMFAIHEECKLDVLDCSQKQTEENPVYMIVPVLVVTHDQYTKNIKNVFKRPYVKGSEGLVWRMFFRRNNSGITNPLAESAKRHELVTNRTFNITEYRLRYLKTPEDIITTVDNDGSTSIIQNCELDAVAENSLANIAVKIIARANRDQIPETFLPEFTLD